MQSGQDTQSQAVSMTENQSREQRNSLVALLVIVGIVFYVILDVIAQILAPHYNPISQAESDLAVGTVWLDHDDQFCAARTDCPGTAVGASRKLAERDSSADRFSAGGSLGRWSFAVSAVPNRWPWQQADHSWANSSGGGAACLHRWSSRWSWFSHGTLRKMSIGAR